MLRIIVFVIMANNISCANVYLLEGKEKPVTIIFDKSLDSVNMSRGFSYTSLRSIKNNFTNTVYPNLPQKSALIVSPTLFNVFGKMYLFYPNEKIKVGADSADLIYLANKKRKRQKDLDFFFTSYQNIVYPTYDNIIDHSLDKINIEEIVLGSRIEASFLKNKKIIDSISKVIRPSKIANRYMNYYNATGKFAKEGFYNTYQDTLETYGLFYKKMYALLPIYNSIAGLEELSMSSNYLNQYFYKTFDIKISRINQENFQETRDIVLANFKSISRDYLLAELYYYSLYNNVILDKKDTNIFFRLCKTKAYKKIIKNFLKQKKHIGSLAKSDDYFLNSRNLSEYKLNDFFKDKIGKTIVLDLWATWCSPCIEDLPKLRALIKDYAAADVTFISLSIDKDIDSWQKWVYTNAYSSENHFLLFNHKETTLAKGIKLEEIPRYILIDKDGNFISANSDSTHSNLSLEFIREYLENKRNDK